jgi:hypothetical protein
MMALAPAIIGGAILAVAGLILTVIDRYQQRHRR